MFHLLKIEWLKVKNYRTFWILSILFLVSIFGINYIVYEIQASQSKNAMAEAVIGSPFQFPNVWKTVTYISSFLLFIPGLLMIISITNEFSFKTHRQNIIDGLSRTQFVHNKMMIATIISLVSTIVVFLVAVFFGLIEGAKSFSTSGIVHVGYFFIQALSYSAFALLFGLLFRRSGISIGVYFLYIVVLENMFAGLLNKYVWHSGTYLPLESTDSLIPFPFFQNVTSQFLYQPNINVLLLVTLGYLLIYYFLSRKKFETADL